MKFILIRHAQSAPTPESHQSEWALTADGEHSCRNLAITLKKMGVSHIYTSHEAKAIKTAELTAKYIGISFTIWARLQEQNNDGVGWFETAEGFKAAVQKLFEQPDQAVFGPETAQAAGKRFDSALAEIAKQHPADSAIAIATHGRVMTSFLMAHQAVDPIPFWRSLTFPDAVEISWPKVAVIGRVSSPAG